MFDFSTNTAPQPKPVNRRQMVLGDLEAMEHFCKAVLGRNEFVLEEVFPLRVLRINVLKSSNMRYDQMINIEGGV